MELMMPVNASKESEAGALRSKGLVAATGRFNGEMARAGALLAGEGLHPSSRGVRVAYAGSKRIVTDGPFAATTRDERRRKAVKR